MMKALKTKKTKPKEKYYVITEEGERIGVFDSAHEAQEIIAQDLKENETGLAVDENYYIVIKGKKLKIQITHFTIIEE